MKPNATLQKLTRLFSSMKFGMILLFFMAVFSISGTVLPQGNELSIYENQYSPLLFKLIQVFHLDRVFTSWWFVALVGLLALNLLFCSLTRLPVILRQMKASRSQDQLQANPLEYQRTLKNPGGMADIFKTAGFAKFQTETGPEGTFYRAKRHSAGYLGSWLTHMGLFLIIVFYVLGKWFGYETVIYGVPGTEHPVLETGYTIRIDDFDILYREDYSVHQYITDATIFDKAGAIIAEGPLQVNQPMRGKGFEVFQSGTGWAMEASLSRNGQLLEKKTLLQSEAFVADEAKIVLHFMDFYPDLVLRDGQPFTRTPFPENPWMLYALYYDGAQVLFNMAAPGQTITYREYSFTLTEPKLFTVLQVVSDPGTIPVLLGGCLLLLGICLSFYWVPQELYGLDKGDGTPWIAAYARRNQAIFYGDLDRKLKVEGGLNQ